MAEPTTQKGQLDALLTALKVPDFSSALAAIPTLQASAENCVAWDEQRQALFTSLGGAGTVPEHYDFSEAINAIASDRNAIWKALGASEQEGAILALENLRTHNNNLQAVQTSIFGALKVTDHAGAMRAITDIDGRIEAGIDAGVIARAASAGLSQPVAKQPEIVPGAANTITRAAFEAMNAKERLAFSQNGGRLMDEAA